MRRLMISAFTSGALFAAATAIQWSPPPELSAGTTVMPSLQELHTAAGVNKLPIENFEDQALIFPGVAKH